MAAVLGIRIINYIERSLALEITQKIVLSDAKCVLQEIKTQKILQIFVNNRITGFPNLS